MKKLACIVVNLLYGFCIIVVVLMMVQLFVFTSFKIPSDSMEPSLLAGDYILVDKCSKGARMFNIFEAVDGEDIKIHRMPGWRSFKRNDVLVFNIPYPDRLDSVIFDVMKYYVKRCVALPGDTFEIWNGQYQVRGCEEVLGNAESQQALLQLLDSGAVQESDVVTKSFPYDKQLDWTIREFGPFYVPVKEEAVTMTPISSLLYRNVIEWEQKRKLRLKGDTVLLGDSAIYNYCFKENYYFMAGDKVANSRDSRYWGLLPESFIVGKAVLIWKSVDKEVDKIRWKRILKRVE